MKNDVLDRLGITEQQLQTMMANGARRGMRRKFSITLPFHVYCAFQEIMHQQKAGEIDIQQAESDFRTKVMPHVGKMPDGFDAARGDCIEFDYERSAPRVVLPQ